MKKCWAILLLFLLATSASAKDTLIVANLADIRTLDPLLGADNVSANVHLQMFDNLVFIAADGSIVPMLAEKWEQPDPTTYTFYLRKGVKFHNGEECTAEDVKFTLDRALGPLGTMSRVLIKDLESVEVVDKYTVTLKLKRPVTPFLYALAESWGGIVNKKAIESGEHEKSPVGTGPFKFVSWTKSDRVVLERFEDYYGQKPVFKTLIIRAIPETSSRMIELESGGIDIAYRVHHTDIKRLEDNPSLQLFRFPSFRTEYLGFNCSKPPLDDIRVRRAIAAAIDVQGMQKAVWHGVGYAPAGPLPKGFPYSDPDLPPHLQDTEKALALLKEAGVKGLELSLWTNENKERIDAATIIQNMLAEVGITVNIKVMEYGTFLDGCRRGEQDLFLSGWGNNLPDPEYSLARSFTSLGIGANNFSFFKNEAFDKQMAKGLETPDGPKRADVYKAAQKMMLEELPALYWSVQEDLVGASKNVKNFEAHPRGFYRLWLVTFAEN